MGGRLSFYFPWVEWQTKYNKSCASFGCIIIPDIETGVLMTSQTNRNPGTPLDLDWVMGAHVNKSAVERRIATLPGKRTVKKEWQAAWLLRAVTCIDLTTLGGDDTPGRVKRLCAKARMPIRPDMLEDGTCQRESDRRRGVRLPEPRP
jgi:hypothetical protein